MEEVVEILRVGLAMLALVPAVHATLSAARAAASAASLGYVPGQDVNSLVASLFALLFAVSMYRIALAVIATP